jgi:hypothetical protein
VSLPYSENSSDGDIAVIPRAEALVVFESFHDIPKETAVIVYFEYNLIVL